MTLTKYKAKIKIKKTTKKDREILLLFRYLLRKYEYGVEKLEGCNIKKIMGDKKEIEEGLKSSKVFFFIVYYNNYPIGYSKLKIKKIKGEIMGHMGANYVLEEFRGKGIGKKLMKVRLDVLKKKGIKKASVETYKNNKLSIKVQKSLGFKIVEYNPKTKLYRMEKIVK